MSESETEGALSNQQIRKRGRPKKDPTVEPNTEEKENTTEPAAKRKRGRPPKPESERLTPKREKVPGRGRGRPRKEGGLTPPAAKDKANGGKRGRPKKIGTLLNALPASTTTTKESAASSE
eukprot:CAMPEP_0173143314 /NCGR_PEP_ID=MMETSP1105-20130129/6600_1 /TAXON_ID=2985 /ORGANISM="Ochromonas sp., Strain BG-1" /LENGTH=120 /DNA_ID=CAMNT_0014056853 /DNA_START=150 /DNA_END=512 /DNA_ORIENTATION=-